ncbi:MAG: hypothetical protein HGA87_01295 [Desulfobulbaceae bacterium]|nr:hypothetical protein [Desulfobulbaceae bacterium]
MAITSTDQETRYTEQVLQHGGSKTMLENTIEFIRDNVDIEDVFTQEQIKAYATKYMRIEDVYSLDDIEEYWKANKQED